MHFVLNKVNRFRKHPRFVITIIMLLSHGELPGNNPSLITFPIEIIDQLHFTPYKFEVIFFRKNSNKNHR